MSEVIYLKTVQLRKETFSKHCLIKIVIHLFIYSLIFQEIIEKIIFPLMSYTEKDAELWETDPYEYIRVKVKVHRNMKLRMKRAWGTKWYEEHLGIF